MTSTPEQQPAADAPRPAATRGSSQDRDDLGLTTYFQPFYNLRSDGLQGLEALARRSDVGDGPAQLPPAFLADDEAVDEMRDIDLWILDDALSELARWYELEGRTELILSVNFSRHSVTRPSLVDDVTDILERHGMPGERLLVDISVETFRRFTAAGDGSLTNLAGLRELGVTICLDHFTSADLDVLDDAVAVPVDIIKLDPRELQNLSEPGLADVAERIQNLGLPAVAAGFETDEQLALVRRLDFEWAQGFLLGAPVEATQALLPPSCLS